MIAWLLLAAASPLLAIMAFILAILGVLHLGQHAARIIGAAGISQAVAGAEGPAALTVYRVRLGLAVIALSLTISRWTCAVGEFGCSVLGDLSDRLGIPR